MSDIRLTAAQLKALLWLPADGTWRMFPGRVSSALRSLHLRHKSLVEFENGAFGSQGGWCVRWRLTPAGIAESAERRAA